MVYGFKIVQEMTTGLSDWMDAKGYTSVDQLVGRAVPRVTDWQHLNLDYVVKAHIDQTKCIQCGRCHIACEDTSHQAISHLKDGKRHYEVIEEECVGLQPVRRGLPGRGVHHAGAADGGGGPADGREGRRASDLAGASEQPGGEAGGAGAGAGGVGRAERPSPLPSSGCGTPMLPE